ASEARREPRSEKTPFQWLCLPLSRANAVLQEHLADHLQSEREKRCLWKRSCRCQLMNSILSFENPADFDLLLFRLHLFRMHLVPWRYSTEDGLLLHRTLLRLFNFNVGVGQRR